MKKIVLILCGILAAAMAKGQDVIDNFEVGPYEVDYLGEGDINYRLKRGVNLYEYYGLKTDTTIVRVPESKPLKRAVELGLSFATPRFQKVGAFNSFGVYGTVKSKVADFIYLNYGGMLAFSYGQYGREWNCLKDFLVEAGVPLSVEFANIDHTKASLFANVGFAPVYYATLSAKAMNGEGNEVDVDKKNGLYVAPRVEAGGFIPVNEHLIKIGVFGEYRICCAKAEDNIFKERIGRAFVGVRLGYVF